MNTHHHPLPSMNVPESRFEAGLAKLSNHSIVRYLRQYALPLVAIPLAATVSFLALSQSSPPSIPVVALSSDPLYAARGGDKPVLALALSVEFPTVGAQYVDPDNRGSSSDDPTYSPTIEYLGYYDAESCYTYDDAGTGAPSGQASNYKRFIRRGPAIARTTPDTANPTWTSRMCWNGTTSYTKDDGTTPASSTSSNDAFSGNFLNWASNSAIDMLRLSLTGGDRVIDTPTLTVLQRAMIPDGDPISMGNSTNFPSKRLYRSGTSRAITSTGFASASYASGVPYFGAVPTSMATAAGSNDIFVANTLNRIYFGTAKTGNNSGGFSSYTLGGGSAAAAIQKGPSSTYSASLPADAVLLGGENVTYTFTGTYEIWFGKNDATTTTWTVLPASGGIDCYWQGGGGPYGGINDPRSGVQKNCYRRPYSGSWTPTTSSAALNSDGYFFARVQVCDRDPTTYTLKDKRFWNLCTQYSDGAASPHANYKPTGAVQKYSDQLRLAAFGYLMDQTNGASGRYGGVLRAPIKYVGSKTYDTSGNLSGSNANQEWDPATGVFNTNSDNNTTVQTTDGRGVYLSGVTTYINQFGRTGSVPGRYKKYDPVGELYYQALRYLQGLQPTPAAVSGITSTMYDGFPVFTTWTDPYGDGRSNTADYSCLKSNIVVIGDKNSWDYNSRLPTPNAAGNVPNIAEWQGVAAKFESNTSGTYLDGAGVWRNISNPNTPNSASMGSASGDVNIVGAAYWAHTHDIRAECNPSNTSITCSTSTLQRPGLRVKTFTFDVNEYGGSNDPAVRRTSNQYFRASKYGGFEADPSNTSQNPYNTYGNPFVNEKDGTNNNYVWQDTDTRASRVGEANTYFLQSDARGVLSAFDDIFSRASTSAYNIGGGANNSKSSPYKSVDTIYQGKFDTSDWSGDLEASSVTDHSITWTAATRLGALTNPAASRNIVIGKVGATASPVATAFTWADIDPSLQTALNTSPDTSASDSLGEARLNYLRGDKSNEGNPFRARTKLIGDIINSGIVYSGKPSTSINSSDYASYASTNAGRTPAVFVGANDGMLHAFNATTGDELFAYIPSWLGSKLAALTSTSYGTSTNLHKSYVDSVPVVAEAQVGSSWKSVLVGGTGAGGQGVFALDVTNPSSFSASNVLWEFTDADDADLGNVVGKPQILKMRTGSGTYKWFAVFGSGVNNYQNDGTGRYSSTGQPALFLLDLGKAAGASWALGSNYYKIQLPIDSTLSATLATGLINFSAELGLVGEVARIYMGDLHGNLWKLDFSKVSGTADWNINKLSTFNKGTESSPIPYPLFIAQIGSVVQPITVAPVIAIGPTASTRYILFGTGKYYESSDKTSTATQTEYMIFDDGSSSGDSDPVGASAVSGRARLKQGSTNTSTRVISVPAFTPGRATTDLNTETIRSGWYADLPTAGERQISDPNLPPLSPVVTFNTVIPGVSGSSGCAAANDGGNTYTVEVATGNGRWEPSQVGLLGEIMVVDRPDQTVTDHADNTGLHSTTLVRDTYQLGTQGWKKIGSETQHMVTGRLSWRQINNYYDRKNAAP